MYLQWYLELLSDRSDVQVVSGTLESIENTGFFNAFPFLSQEKTKTRPSGGQSGGKDHLHYRRAAQG